MSVQMQDKLVIVIITRGSKTVINGLVWDCNNFAKNL